MPNDKLKFWVKCPECKKAFGVFPRAVLQYLNRLIEAHGFDAPEPQEPKAQESRESETAQEKKPYRRGYAPRRYQKREG